MVPERPLRLKVGCLFPQQTVTPTTHIISFQDRNRPPSKPIVSTSRYSIGSVAFTTIAILLLGCLLFRAPTAASVRRASGAAGARSLSAVRAPFLCAVDSR